VPGYDPHFAKSPVPFQRIVQVLEVCHERWFDFFDVQARRSTGLARGGHDEKVWDVDVVLNNAVEILRLIAEISGHIGDDATRAALHRWREKVLNNHRNDREDAA
jgi:hypothetical protein